MKCKRESSSIPRRESPSFIHNIPPANALISAFTSEQVAPKHPQSPRHLKKRRTTCPPNIPTESKFFSARNTRQAAPRSGRSWRAIPLRAFETAPLAGNPGAEATPLEQPCERGPRTHYRPDSALLPFLATAHGQKVGTGQASDPSCRVRVRPVRHGPTRRPRSSVDSLINVRYPLYWVFLGKQWRCLAPF